MTDITIETVEDHRILFDKKNPLWDKEAEYNLLFLKTQTDYQQLRLQHRGYLFVNEVLSTLAFPITSDGQVSGWLATQGRFEAVITPDVDNPSNFWLEFSVHGVIVNEI